MKPRVGKFLIVSVLMCILPLALYPQTIAAPATPKISVEPARNAFGTDTTSVGDTFTVNIVTSGWEDPGLYSYELKLYFDPTLLNATEAEYPPDHFLPAPNFEVPVDLNNEAGYVLFGVTKLGDVPGSTGSGVLGTVTFEIITAPPPDLSSDLNLSDIILLDPEGNEIPEYEVEHGFYEFTLPKAPVYMKVGPETIGATTVGQNIRVEITINELRAEDKLVALEWKLGFDTSLLEVLGEVIGVTEGIYLMSEAEKASAESGDAYGTAFGWSYDEGTDFIYGWNLYYKHPWREEPPEIFPGHYSQGGTLATVIFNATQMPEDLTTSELKLFDVIMLDIDGKEIKYDRLESGTYLAPAEAGDLNYDNKVNILDLYIFGSAFGSYPGHPRWDSRADLNGDGKVNILDGVIIALSFHT